MLSIAARPSACQAARQSSVRTFSSLSPWGSDHWRHDKGAFISWCNKAVAENGVERRQFNGFCALAFGDVDTDKDGFINPGQFDRYLEKVAAIPRRFGLAPLSSVDRSVRLARHTELFDAIDKKDGPARGKLGLDQVMEWSMTHVAGKVPQIPKGDVALYHVENYTEVEYVGFVERAVNNPGSYEHSSFYNFILNCFVEADSEGLGRIKYDEFDALLTRAATVPRNFGLAPASVNESVRKEMFKKMELKRDGKPMGFVTHRKFWEWTVEHTKMKIELQKAGKGWRENH